MDPVEIGETSGAVPSLGGRGHHGRTEGWHLHQLEGMMKWWRRDWLAFEGAALSVTRLWWTAGRKGGLSSGRRAGTEGGEGRKRGE